MSFTTDVICELLENQIHKTCCRKAMLLGMFWNAEAAGTQVRAEFKTRQAADFCAEILKRQFSVETAPVEYVRAGRRLYRIEVSSKAISAFIRSIRDESVQGGRLFELAGFRCAECSHSLLRGIFVACGSINEPSKGYHLEFASVCRRSADLLCDLLTKDIGKPGRINRAGRYGVYFKNNSAMTDLLYYIGAVRSSFDMANVCIEKDIRNAENRATNCVASNISRSVEASRKQIEQIEWLDKNGGFFKLEEDLRYTATLRYENPASSLSELAMMHQPPITKSGLNRRLGKIMELAAEERLRLEGEKS